MGLVVTGISQNGDTTALEAALKAAGLPLDPVQLIGPDDSTQGAARGVVNPGYITGGTGQGTGVPGITSGKGTGTGGYGTRYFRNETLSDRLGDLEIPTTRSTTTSRRSKRVAASSRTSRGPTTSTR